MRGLFSIYREEGEKDTWRNVNRWIKKNRKELEGVDGFEYLIA